MKIKKIHLNKGNKTNIYRNIFKKDIFKKNQ